MRITKSSWLGLGCACAFALGLATAANAVVVVEQADLGCSTLTASGTTTAPFVTFYAYHLSTGTEYFEVLPVVGGVFDYTFNFPPPTSPSSINYEVWGSVNDYTNIGDAGYWDNEAYYDAVGDCSAVAIPTMDVRGYALLALLLGAAGFFVLRRRTQLSR